ncbi:DUF455 family protein [Paenibacillus cymbidii]|uniref:DUF455 family protein n=1 Tax=Paenibacillus cymbidii TaxID=1639034 RepID=UPI00107FDA91|nr:DUF455 family protein [Paenibacillus cymbidii]
MAEMVLAMGIPGKRSVEEASYLLKRLYLVERETMRTLGGYLVNVADWNLKTQLPRHIWQDAQRADALRTRILELRYPKRDVDQEHDEDLLAVLNLLIRCKGDAELLEGIYFVVKRALAHAYSIYLETADLLDDAPTVSLIRRFIPEIKEQIHDAVELKAQLETRQRRDAGHAQTTDEGEWRYFLMDSLRRIGGVLGSNKDRVKSPGAASNVSIEADPLLAVRPPYEPPLVPVRDPRFAEARYHYPIRPVSKFIERQVYAAINHVNEIWAAEIPALVMWRWNDMPWDFYLDCARWAYDESRHCLMGVRRLQAWGFEIGIDYPVIADHYLAVSGQGELAVLALLHAFEVNGPYWKSQMKTEFENQGDTSSSQDFDYDWADESIHLAYGHKWVLHRLKGDMDALEDLKEQVMDDWNKWVAQARAVWDYEPFLSRIDARIAAIEGEPNGSRHG